MCEECAAVNVVWEVCSTVENVIVENSSVKSTLMLGKDLVTS